MTHVRINPSVGTINQPNEGSKKRSLNTTQSKLEPKICKKKLGFILPQDVDLNDVLGGRYTFLFMLQATKIIFRFPDIFTTNWSKLAKKLQI